MRVETVDAREQRKPGEWAWQGGPRGGGAEEQAKGREVDRWMICSLIRAALHGPLKVQGFQESFCVSSETIAIKILKLLI